MSVVNGFVCSSSCDVAKAKRGEDPHPATGSDGGVAGADPKAAPGTSNADQPAVIFDGALSALTDASQVAAGTSAADAQAADPRKPGSLIDLAA